MKIQTTSAPSGPMFLMTAVLLAVAACGGGVAAAPGAPTPVDVARSPATSPKPSATPGPTSTPTPTLTPIPSAPTAPLPSLHGSKASWSTAIRVTRGDCSSFVAVIDGAGRYHVAADCDQQIRYASSTNGRTWKAASFKPPLHRLEVDPQVAIDGATLYLAYTRLRPTEGGCGDDGLVEVGVFYRTRHLPAGKWSAPKQIGHAGDRLQSFRVVGRVIHETVITNDGQGPVFYASQRGSTHRRVRISGALETSLRIGDDGRARVAFTTGRELKIATIQGTRRVSTKTVFAAKDVFASSPVLVLGANDRSFVSWTATTWSGGGCADGGDVSPREGTWFATDASGRWERKRLTGDVSKASLVADVETGRVHVLYADDRGYRFVTRSASGTWTGSRLDRSTDLMGLILRRDPASGAFLVVGARWAEPGDAGNGIYAMTRR